VVNQRATIFHHPMTPIIKKNLPADLNQKKCTAKSPIIGPALFGNFFGDYFLPFELKKQEISSKIINTGTHYYVSSLDN